MGTRKRWLIPQALFAKVLIFQRFLNAKSQEEKNKRENKDNVCQYHFEDDMTNTNNTNNNNTIVKEEEKTATF